MSARRKRPRGRRDDDAAKRDGNAEPKFSMHAALAEAVQRRRTAGLLEPAFSARTNAWRLVHERWDGLDGLIVDVLGPVAVLRLRSARWRETATLRRLASALAGHGWTQLHALHDGRAKHAARDIDEQQEALNRELAAMGLAPRERAFPIVENGLRYEVRLNEGFSQGLFLDMREVRNDLRARWTGRRVANLFAYTSAFGVALEPHNEVVNVDVSRRWLAWGEHNYALNDLAARDDSFVHKDAFAFLETAVRRGIRWDAIILDPPAQSRGKRGVSRPFSLRKDLGRLIEEGLGALAPGGELFVSTNLESLAPAAFRKLVIGVARDRGYWLETQWHPTPDYPVAAERWHLKSALLREKGEPGKPTCRP